ncbi:TniQ family protein [Streptomyces sp. NBC_01602]|uniref:TniQ family protein n=1 Tax=Streptomyces sp. NBC_01602 TaxID=2975893 RepID=UPI0038703D29|nr:TniQ family protein [Streptomyces sp. NBC_01602]
MSAPRALPLRISFLRGETNGSYVQRLAWANGLQTAELLNRLGSGPATPIRPDEEELYLNAAALERLSALTGRPTVLLQQALRCLREEFLLTAPASMAAWTWLSPAPELPCVLRGCHRCGAAKGAFSPFFVWSDMPWQTCRRHGCWLDATPLPVTARATLRACMPLVLRAEQQRIRFERRMGPAGRILFADALSACAYWWNNPRLSLPVWIERQRPFPGLDYSAPFPALVLIYPEVVRLAQMFAQWERQHQAGLLNPDAWMRQMRLLFHSWGSPFEIDEVRLPVEMWLHRHRGHTVSKTRAPRWHPPSQLAKALSTCVPRGVPKAVGRAQATWGKWSCLPFRYARGMGVLPQERRTDILHLRPLYEPTEGTYWAMLPQPGPGCEALDPRRLC